ncbi:hypothetical protein CAC42_3687 [Sphaceloma murrayae]|uniref:Uncharacterized protein n=1 Tax=Sphaceloma murrayae TaxID=2082308 RepID=A0A2K1QHJ6_9PEZI|nr:hypothetical protein CAC42_3687 [Sphaceloma murrayae]
MAYALLIPASIALALYFLVTFVLIPFIRRYRSRYDQYVPLQTVTERVAAGTSTLRDRLADLVTRIVLPSRRFGVVNARDEEGLYGLEDGEEMDDFLEGVVSEDGGRERR